MVYKMKLAEISEIELEDDPFRPYSLAFTKLHGNGNDFILIDEIAREQVPEESKRRFAVAASASEPMASSSW
jgi:diaminopimelate epimerase